MNKIKTKILFFLTCFMVLDCVKAQKSWKEDLAYFDNIKHKEFMVNIAPLVSQFVPFNASSASSLGIYDIQYRKLKNGKGLRWGLGVDIDANSNSDKQFMALRFGWIKRKQISQHIHFTRAFDINLVAEDAFANNRKFGFTGLAPSFSVGIEYSFNEYISISTEGSLFVGLLPLDGDDVKIKFTPPVSLFFHVRF